MDRALRVEFSEEINEAASSPREEELFRELDRRAKTFAEVVDDVEAVVSAKHQEWNILVPLEV
jgi:hypothetical protein